MQLFSIISKQLKLMLNNRLALLAIIASPLLLTYFFTFFQDTRTTVYIVDKEKSAYSRQLTQYFQKDQSMYVLLLSETEMTQQIEEQGASVGIVIDSGFGANTGNPKHPHHIKMVLNRNDANHESNHAAVYKKLSAFFSLNTDNPLSQVRTKQPSPAEQNANASGLAGRRLNGFMLMFLWFVVIQGFRTLIDEQENGLERRLLAMPLPFIRYLWSKIIAAYLFGLTIIAIVLIAGNWMLNIPLLEGLGLKATIWAAYLFALTGLVMLLVPWVKSQQNFTVSGSVIMAVAGIFGGSFFTIEDHFPEWFLILTKAVPGTWAAKGLNVAYQYGNPALEIMEISGRLCIVGILSISLSFLLFKYKLRKQLQIG
ncbi:ABC transporter permease [Paenibacillus sp. SN-8-1]|uniref:ABC transporter permease n=1 Tax=Paenibacillus sp. SN-8-1 TaxID=3435409 RepID=UPI003D9A8AB2